MASKVISDINEKVLQCCICQERFKTPKTLGCQHSFCLVCIEGWVKKNKGVLSCPMCRQTFKVPQKGLSALPSSYFIIQLLEYTAETEKESKSSCCILCEKTVTRYCKECSAFLCNHCADNHLKMLPCRGHTVMPIEKYKSMDVKDRAAVKPVLCPKHNDVAVEFYCVGCSIPICMKCTVVNHKGHDLQELDTAFQKFKRDANQTLTRSSAKIQEINAELTQHIKDAKQQKESVEKCKYDIKQQAIALRKMIDESERNLLLDVESKSKEMEHNRQQETLVIKEKINELQNCSVFIESLIKAPQPTTALFDATETLKNANKVIASHEQQSRNPRYKQASPLYRNVYHQKDIKSPNVDATMSLCFDENKIAKTIGSVYYTKHNPQYYQPGW